MRIFRSFALATLAAAACASPQSRIASHRSAFDSYPPAVQKRIRDGQADIGFTREQVAMALGRPDRRYTRKTAAASQDVWAYGVDSGGPRVSLGFGLGSSSGLFGGGIGAATGIESDGDRGARVRVVFQDEAVVSVESREK